jgi:hypothetical protein
MNQEQQVQKALDAIRAIDGLWSEDVAALTAALSCQIAKDNNAHAKLHKAAIDQLDDLANYLNDEIGESVARAEAEEAATPKRLRQCDEEGAVQRFESWMREVVA